MTIKIKIIISLFASLFIALCIGFGIGIYNESKSVNFGSTNDPIPRKRLKEECCKTINRVGLENINAYGSGIIYFQDFKNYFKDKLISPDQPEKTNKNIYVINLLTDEMYYYKDRCLRWYGLGYTNKDLGQHIFARKLFKSAYKSLLRLFYGTPPTDNPALLQTERQIIENLGGDYYIPFKGNDDWLGNQNYIDEVIHYFESLPKGAKLYIHCAHGRGRTTTFLVMYDIFLNSNKVSLKDISDRHFCLGRENVLNTKLWAQGTWTQEALDARKDLIERFYAFMTDPHGYGHQSWTQWINSKDIEKKEITIHRTDKDKISK